MQRDEQEQRIDATGDGHSNPPPERPPEGPPATPPAAPPAVSAEDAAFAPLNRPPLGPTHPLYGVGAAVGSMVACALVAIELLLALLMLTVAAPLLAGAAARAEGVTLPRSTQWLLAMPPMAWFVLLVVLIVALLAKEWLIANKRLTLLINVVLLLSSLVWFPLLVMAIIQPWGAIMRAAYS